MKKYAFLFCFLLFSFNSWAQIEEQLEDWKFLSVGALVGYQYQQSSLLELGVGLNLEYKFLYLSSSFSIENEFDKKITGLKGNFQLGFGDHRFAYIYGGINYISY